MNAVAMTPELITKHGITDEEYQKILSILGDREPTLTELGIFSVMWSEHCSYKSSRPELKKFPTEGERVLVKAGEENAGVIDIGDGWATAFKIESHNHPSAVEPFQGAATGVGGIIRDIFTMGARPVALMDSLRFGGIGDEDDEHKTNRRLLSGVVSGIAHYGNCIGIPTVGGELNFDPSYTGNPLVNVFCLGVLRHDQIRLGKATGVGNSVFYVGAKTGRDGLAGAAFASRDLTEESKEDRPAVQVGDPFLEKLLLEACLELFEHPSAVAGVQDMGAAGLTCSTCETASRAGTGIEIELNKVPLRETGMTPYEIMLSESQERMLIIVNRGHEETVTQIFDKWDIDSACIGHVTDTGRLVVKHNGETVANIPARPLADEAPVYQREAREPASFAENHKFNFQAEVAEPDNLKDILPRLLLLPALASKRWVYRQYDHMVQTGTVLLPGSDSAVIRIPTADAKTGQKDKFLAMTTDCNHRICALDPYEGAKAAVAEAARNLACAGARPLAITDNLNFGNPLHPEIFWQLRRAVEGLSEACRAFNIPVTGGNVSLYNQSPRGAVAPTPVVGMVGQIDEEFHITPSAFQQEGDAIILAGGLGDETGMNASVYLQEIHGGYKGAPAKVDLEAEIRLGETLRTLIRFGEVDSAHDLSEGGLAFALAEACLTSKKHLGAFIDLPLASRADVILFNETPGRVILTTRAKRIGTILDAFEQSRIPALHIGTVTPPKTNLSIQIGARVVSYPVQELWERYECALPQLLD